MNKLRQGGDGRHSQMFNFCLQKKNAGGKEKWFANQAVKIIGETEGVPMTLVTAMSGLYFKLMIAFDASFNGKRVCIAGADDLAVLNKCSYLG